MPAAARRAATAALELLDAGHVDLGEALSRVRDPLTDARDRALTTELVTGTLRRRGTLDYQLQRASSRPLGRLDAVVRDVLRVSAYQLLYLDRIPPRAVINDAVDLVKTAGVASAAGFVNAVLRRLHRDLPALAWPDRPAAGASLEAWTAYLAVVESHPEWLVRRWIERLGVTRAAHWLAFDNTVPELTLAANRLRTDRDALADELRTLGIETVLTHYAPLGLRTADARVLETAALREGRALIQDEASQLVPLLVAAESSSRVFDACAAPGGKTVALAAAAHRGVVIAADVRPRRIRVLRQTLQRAGARVPVLQLPAREAWPLTGASFDRILLDAPCSGLGTLRREPDIKWRRTAHDLPGLAALQSDLLHRAAPHVAPGGRLIYSTCSTEPDENERVVAAFLAEAPEFSILPLGRVEAIPPAVAALASPEGFLQTTPDAGLEGFFGAVLQKRL